MLITQLHSEECFVLAGGPGSLDQAKTLVNHVQIRASARSIPQLTSEFLDDKFEPVRMMRARRQPGIKVEDLTASLPDVQAQRIVLNVQSPQATGDNSPIAAIIRGPR